MCVSDPQYWPRLSFRFVKPETESSINEVVKIAKAIFEEISDELLGADGRGIEAQLKEIAAFVLSELQYLQGRFAGENPRPEAELAKHYTEITLTPESDSYELRGKWDLLGDVRSDGAGGQNRTGYARLFRAALYH